MDKETKLEDLAQEPLTEQSQHSEFSKYNPNISTHELMAYELVRYEVHLKQYYRTNSGYKKKD